MKTIPALACVFFFATLLPAQEPQFPSTSQAEMEKALGGAEIVRAIDSSQHVEGVPVKVDEKDPGNKGWLRWHVIETSKAFEISPENAKRLKSLLADPTTYLEGADACYFDPGIKLVFNDGDRDAVTLLLCLKCGDICVIRGGKQIGYASFEPAYPKVMDLAQSIFPDDKDILDIIDQQQAQIRESRIEANRWLAGMPKSIRPLWTGTYTSNPSIGPDLMSPLRAAVVTEFPDESKRILALLTWYGSGAGPWSGFPSYESIAENLLLDYPTTEIVATIQANPLSDQQLEGAARLFADWDFSRRRPGNLKMLPAPLKKRLLEYSHKSTDTDKIARAKNAFE